MAVTATRYQWSAAEYHRLREANIFTEDDRVELLDGEIFKMSPIGSPHAGCVNRLNHLLSRHVEETAVVCVQNPIRLSDYSEPQPDISVCRPRDDFYGTNHPEPADIILLVEVADSSLIFDREVKLPLYAEAGIPELWIVDLTSAVVTVYTELRQSTYRTRRQFGRGDTVSSQALPDLALSVDSILG